MQTFDHILIFKTNISSADDKLALQPLLDGNPCVKRWSVDLNDCDFVLRIESDKLSHQQVIDLIHTYGFECFELT